ncbi:MAG: hypothetical protein DRQ35_02655, partial [Gammaproteobacteria bacterium]
INGNGLNGIFFDVTNEKFLNEMKLFALLNDLEFILSAQPKDKKDLIVRKHHAYVHDPEAAKVIVETTERHNIFTPKEKRDEVLDFIKQGRIITFHKQFN